MARDSDPDVVAKLEVAKKRYDIGKWLIGIAIGLAVGAFTVGASFQSAMAYLGNRSIPPGMIAFFSGPRCPPKWDRADELRGRYIVGADPNHPEDVGKPIGIALESGENRPAGKHTHGYVHTGPHANGGRDRMMGGGNGGFDDPVNQTDGGADATGPLKDGTNAPYLILIACRSPA